jgi:hypothetical protein
VNKKFREKRNIVLYYNYKMNEIFPRYLQQRLRARVVGFSLSEAAEPIAGKLFNIKISDIVRGVDAFCIDAAGDLKVDEYPIVDTTAIELGLASGSSVLLQIGASDETPALTCKVLSVHKDPEPGAGALTLTVSGDGGAPGMQLYPASVIVIVVPSIAAPSVLGWGLQFHDWDGAQNNEMFGLATYEENQDKSSGIITFNNPGAGSPTFIWSPASSKLGTPWLIMGKRVGSKKTETMVCYIRSYKAAGNKIELRLSKKGLKSKGCAAKKAVAGFNSGEYRIQNIYPVQGGVGLNSSNPPGVFLTATGTLTKTDVLGTYTLKFASGEKERVYNYDEKKKEVSSKSANKYLGEVAQSLPGIAASTLVKLRLDPLETGRIPMTQIYGLMVDLAWSDEPPTAGGSFWIATVKTSLADAEMLGDVTGLSGCEMGVYDVFDFCSSFGIDSLDGASPPDYVRGHMQIVGFGTSSCIVLRRLPVPLTTTKWWFYSSYSIFRPEVRWAARYDDKLFFYGEDLIGGQIHIVGMSIRNNFKGNFEETIGVNFDDWLKSVGDEIGGLVF